MGITKKEEFVEDIFNQNSPDEMNFSMDMDFDNVFNDVPEVEEIEGTSSSDGLVLSLTTLGKVDIEYISKVTNKTMEDVIADLKGSIFQNPLSWDETYYKGWETKEEYLSGNLRFKYKLAEEANKKYDGIFTPNLESSSLYYLV